MAEEEKAFKSVDETSCEGLGALKTALKAEQEGMRSYLEYARRTKDPTGKNMFIALAQDEEDHARIIQEQISRLEGGLGWCAYKERESELKKLLPGLKQVEARKRSTDGMNELDALRVALEQEKAAIELYTGQAETLKDEQAREMYRKLVAMEEPHYDFIQAQIDHIEGTGFWFGIPEFSLEEQ